MKLFSGFSRARASNVRNTSNSSASQAITIISNRLYWWPVQLDGKSCGPHSLPPDGPDDHFFTVDDIYIYWNFFLDFGPLNLGQLYRFCELLNQKLQDPRLAKKRIYFCTSSHAHKRTNSACLLASYAVLYMNKSPEEAWSYFKNVYPTFPPFHDASPVTCTYKLTILDVLRGIARARANNFFDFRTFDVDEYEHFERPECGDLNWIVKDKFVAFAGPHDSHTSRDGYHTLTPEDYIPHFKKHGVELIIRLNKKYYDERRFTRAGFKHLDLYYLDGSNPPDHLLKKFLRTCEQTKGAIAVHCKAGLGRTGTCIGAYLMKHFRVTAADVIGWMRVCRPGSIIGPQQHFLCDIERRMWAEGEEYDRQLASTSHSTIPRSNGIPPRSPAHARPLRHKTADIDDLSKSTNALSLNRSGAASPSSSVSSRSSHESSPKPRSIMSSLDSGTEKSIGTGVHIVSSPVRGTGREHSSEMSPSFGMSKTGLNSSLVSPSNKMRVSTSRTSYGYNPSAHTPGARSVESSTSQGDMLRASRTRTPQGGAYSGYRVGDGAFTPS